MGFEIGRNQDEIELTDTELLSVYGGSGSNNNQSSVSTDPTGASTDPTSVSNASGGIATGNSILLGLIEAVQGLTKATSGNNFSL